ncbi:hypothetical protein H310_06556 [Aphanomyces invadans]|uniref:Uncharacterized protein n=1 Tax=Aphanomyces invadans TaxID=157072 RepID=A0A024U5P5_9STRA|nr:hypothetical protein H310_06556 [Aphanomyces invadans]ETW00893.1 hypothetical protein H310_06556 [Aphanomyces invadans]|eukprot:XP_008869891.1 hypothetical protein H310_06556 [Aphanomyces invadans]
MQKHITDLRSLQQKLLLMGSRVDDEMLGRILLTSVKEAFPTTVEILRSQDEVKSGTYAKRKVDSNQLLYTGKTDNQGPYKKKQAVKNKCHYCNKIGYHAFESRYKKRNLAKGVKRKCMSTQDEDQINSQSGEETGEEAEDDDDYGSKEDKAFDILVNSLDDDNLAYVSHMTTSKAVWDLLVKRYEARTYADVSHIIHELHTKPPTEAAPYGISCG